MIVAPSAIPLTAVEIVTPSATTPEMQREMMKTLIPVLVRRFGPAVATVWLGDDFE
jgi:hypothetical protein